MYTIYTPLVAPCSRSDVPTLGYSVGDKSGKRLRGAKKPRAGVGVFTGRFVCDVSVVDNNEKKRKEETLGCGSTYGLCQCVLLAIPTM